MVSPCINCEFKLQPKEKCTDYHNFCEKLLKFQSNLQEEDSSTNILANARYNTIALSKKKGGNL